jgi:hypothetical protein
MSLCGVDSATVLTFFIFAGGSKSPRRRSALLSWILKEASAGHPPLQTQQVLTVLSLMSIGWPDFIFIFIKIKIALWTST